jgi:site-specific DNA-methyltransferase (adenine-specific)
LSGPIKDSWQSDDGRVTLLLGDCLQILPTLEGIDAIVTDPPYGLNFRGNEWDRLNVGWLDAARNISPLVLCIVPPTVQWDYPRPDWVCCWHRQASMSRSVTGGFNHWSPILVYGRATIPVDTYVLNAMARGNTFNGHPTPKPLPLMRWVLGLTGGSCSVCDPFCGSGTTGVACVQTGRRFLGIEVCPEYMEISKKEIGRAIKNDRDGFRIYPKLAPVGFFKKES